jgi:hypothetical protein
MLVGPIETADTAHEKRQLSVGANCRTPGQPQTGGVLSYCIRVRIGKKMFGAPHVLS